MPASVDQSTPTVRLTGAQRRKAIVTAAQTVFARNGLAGARTSQIADVAGIAESMLYKHFASKRELFEAAVVEPVAEFVENIVDGAEGIFRDDGSDGETFYLSLMNTMTDVLPLLGAALFSDAEEGARFYNTKIVPLLERYVEKVRVSLADVPRADVSASFLGQALIGMVYIVALDTSFREGVSSTPAGRRRSADELRSFVENALAGSAVAARSTALETRVAELEQENETLRRIVSDQAIDLRRRSDARDT